MIPADNADATFEDAFLPLVRANAGLPARSWHSGVASSGPARKGACDNIKVRRRRAAESSAGD